MNASEEIRGVRIMIDDLGRNQSAIASVEESRITSIETSIYSFCENVTNLIKSIGSVDTKIEEIGRTISQIAIQHETHISSLDITSNKINTKISVIDQKISNLTTIVQNMKKEINSENTDQSKEIFM